MEFISAEEFLKQTKEVQEMFMEWWKPSIGDLYCNLYNGQKDNILIIDNVQLELFKTFSNDIKKYGVILLTEGQLRKFIEDKTGCNNLELICDIDINPSQYELYCYKNICSADYNNVFSKLGTDVLQAYWKVALEIAKESVENEYK